MCFLCNISCDKASPYYIKTNRIFDRLSLTELCSKTCPKSATSRRWFTSDTAHCVSIHIVSSVVESVHIS